MKSLRDLFTKWVLRQSATPQNAALEKLQQELNKFIAGTGSDHSGATVTITHGFPNRCLYVEAFPHFNDAIAVRFTETGYADCKYLGVNDKWDTKLSKSKSSDVLEIMQRHAGDVFDEDRKLRNLGELKSVLEPETL